MSHERLRERLAEYCLDLVERGEVAEVAAHVEACHLCRMELRVYEPARQVLRRAALPMAESAANAGADPYLEAYGARAGNDDDAQAASFRAGLLAEVRLWLAEGMDTAPMPGPDDDEARGRPARLPGGEHGNGSSGRRGGGERTGAPEIGGQRLLRRLPWGRARAEAAPPAAGASIPVLAEAAGAPAPTNLADVADSDWSTEFPFATPAAEFAAEAPAAPAVATDADAEAELAAPAVATDADAEAELAAEAPAATPAEGDTELEAPAVATDADAEAELAAPAVAAEAYAEAEAAAAAVATEAAGEAELAAPAIPTEAAGEAELAAEAPAATAGEAEAEAPGDEFAEDYSSPTRAATTVDRVRGESTERAPAATGVAAAVVLAPGKRRWYAPWSRRAGAGEVRPLPGPAPTPVQAPPTIEEGPPGKRRWYAPWSRRAGAGEVRPLPRPAPTPVQAPPAIEEGPPGKRRWYAPWSRRRAAVMVALPAPAPATAVEDDEDEWEEVDEGPVGLWRGFALMLLPVTVIFAGGMVFALFQWNQAQQDAGRAEALAARFPWRFDLVSAANQPADPAVLIFVSNDFLVGFMQASRFPPLQDGRTYVLWGENARGIRQVEVFNPRNGRLIPIRGLPSPTERLLVTEEPADIAQDAQPTGTAIVEGRR